MLSRTSEEHFLQEIIDPGHSEEFGELDLLNHLPADGLEGGEREEEFPEPTA